jgi:hypothetical protein
VNQQENLQRKENGIIFDNPTIPNYSLAMNIGLWDSKHPTYLKAVTGGAIVILKAEDWQQILTADERRHLKGNRVSHEDQYANIQGFIKTRQYQREKLNPSRIKMGLGDVCWDCRLIAKRLGLEE